MKSDKIKELLIKLKEKKQLIIIIIGLLFAIFLILSGSGESCNSKKTNENSSADYDYLSAYATELENKLETLINKLSGVRDVTVVVSFESGKENVYAENKTESEVGETEQYVIVGSNTVLLKELMPKVSGVAVVCKGGSYARNEAEIVRLLSALLGISSAHIYVGS